MAEQTEKELNKVDNLFSEPDSTLEYNPEEQEKPIDQNKASYMNWLRDKAKNIKKKSGYNKIQKYNDKLNKKISEKTKFIDVQVSSEADKQSKSPKDAPRLYKAAAMLKKQSKKMPMIHIGRLPTLNRIGGFNKSFVRPSASEVEGKFTLTKNTPVAVSTGGFGTENEFARNENTNINTPTGKISGGLATRGSLAINMGKTEEPAQLEFTHLHQESYETPNELSNFVKMKTISNSVNRGLMRNNLRNDAMYIRSQPEPDRLSQFIMNFEQLKHEQSIPISSSVGQDRINYSKTTSNTSDNANQGIKRIKSSPLVRYKQLEMKKVNVKMDLKHAKPRSTSQKSSKSNYSQGIESVLNRNIAKVNTKKITKKSGKRKK